MCETSIRCLSTAKIVLIPNSIKNGSELRTQRFKVYKVCVRDLFIHSFMDRMKHFAFHLVILPTGMFQLILNDLNGNFQNCPMTCSVRLDNN